MEFNIKGKKYKLISDLHTHSNFSKGIFLAHAKGSIEDNVAIAKSIRLKKIGITDHGPSHFFFGVRKNKLPLIKNKIDNLSKENDDIEILLGVEANITKNGIDIKKKDNANYDYIAAGFHHGAWENFSDFLFSLTNFIKLKLNIKTKKFIKKNTEIIIRALRENEIYMLTHPGDKLPVDLVKIAEVCAERNTVFEINSHHLSFSKEDLMEVAKTKVSFIVSSDAHSPKNIGNIQKGLELLIAANIPMERVINIEAV
ncbi:MAG: PHP domain-containing protein [Clostridiales Family XIII bacterium]|jgi:putative hydrolase|nr:PHP domain-containing protein [Clostridiales Family XIII bacterium]